MKHNIVKLAIISAIVVGATFINHQSIAADMSYEGRLPASSTEIAVDNLHEVSNGKIEGNLTAKGRYKLSKEGKAKFVIENGEYIDPKDSVFTLAKPNIDQYRLAKYDKINIQTIGYSRSDLGFSGSSGDSTSNSGITLVIGPDGRISTPYTGVLKLAGMTLDEASVAIRDKFATYINHPNVSVNVSEYGGRQIYVMGEVTKPGIYRLGADYMNVFAAVSSANGFLRKARPKHIQVVRVIGDNVYVREVDLESFIKKQDIKQNIALQDGDMIYVPKSHRLVLGEILPYISAAYAVRNW